MTTRQRIIQLESDILSNYGDEAYKSLTDDVYLENIPKELMDLRLSNDIRLRVLDLINFKNEDDVRFNDINEDEYLTDLVWLKDKLKLVFNKLNELK